MGQGDSKINGAIIFAYQMNSRKQYCTESPLNSKHFDPILKHPELYGFTNEYPFSILNQSSANCSLSSSSSSIPVKKLERPDSGYMSPSFDEKIQLAQELSYVDHTYYPSRSSTMVDTQVHDVEMEEGNEDDGLEISFRDVMHSSFDKSLTDVYLSCKAIKRLSSNIGMLTTIRKLDLSNNHLTELPKSIGHLQNLEALSVAKNCLLSLPDTICHLSSLSELDVSYNQLESVTPFLGCLGKLKSLTLAVNRINQLPTEIRGLVNLISLDLSRNPLSVLPAEVAKLPFLRRIRCEDCPFDLNLSYNLKHNPPSLVELCARTSLVRKINLKNVSYLPHHIVNYIKSANICSSCNGPYFESFVLRGRLMEKSDVHIPLQYTLCTAHWSDADDRIIDMFSTQTETFTDPEILPYRPSLPTQSMEKKLPPITRRSHHHTHSSPNDNSVAYAKSTLSKLSTTFKRPNIPW